MLLMQFDRMLPMLFPVNDGFLSRSPVRPGNRHLLFQAPGWKNFYCGKLAKLNYGKVPFELERPEETYQQVMTDLASIPGLIDVTDIEPYSVGISVSGMFDPDEVASKVAAIFQTAFYSEEELELVVSPKKETDKIESSEEAANKSDDGSSLRTEPGNGGCAVKEPS
jgi:hypothetical protein